MKKSLLTGMLLILITYCIFITPSLEQYSFHPINEPTIAAVDTISDTEVVTESVTTILQKWQPQSLFPTDNYTLSLRGEHIPFRFINPVIQSIDMSGFISVVHHQSNYLSYYI